MDAYDTFWEWAEKSLDGHVTISAELHHAVTSLPQEEQYDREKVNDAARTNGWPNGVGIASRLN